MSESSQNPIDSGASLSNYGGDEENSHSPSLIQLAKMSSATPIYCDRVTFCGLTDLLVVKLNKKSIMTELFPHFCHSIARQSARPSPNLSQKISKASRVQTGIKKAVMQDMRDKSTEESERAVVQKIFLQRHARRAVEIYLEMRSTMSAWLLRFTGWILFKIFGRLLSAVDVSEEQIEQLRQLSQADDAIPQIFLPLHRSHVDYILLTWVLWNFDLKLPNVAAGDNLRIPVFGHLMRRLGGFFIKRKLDPLAGRKDYVYRAVLQTYIEELLSKGESLEFFIEAGRSRTGKSLMPKAGLFSIVVESFLQGVIPDAHIIPVAMSYEKILDGNFVCELTGDTKKRETFWGAMKSVWKTFHSRYGRVQIQFSTPISLKSLVASAAQHQSAANHFGSGVDGYKVDGGDGLVDRRNVDFRISASNLAEEPAAETSYGCQDLSVSFAQSDCTQLSPSSPSSFISLNSRGDRQISSTSLFGTDVVVDEHRQLVKTLCHHVLYESTSKAAVMSTQAVAFLLLNNFRSGVELSSLISEFNWLREEILSRGGNVGFKGDSELVVTKALKLLGAKLVQMEASGVKTCSTVESGYTSVASSPQCSSVSIAEVETSAKAVDRLNQTVVVRPNCSHPAVLELQYYSNSVLSHFQMDAIVACSIGSLLPQQQISQASFDSFKVTLTRDELMQKCLQLTEVLQFEFVFNSLDFVSLESCLLGAIERFTLGLKQFLRRQSSDDSGTEEICERHKIDGPLELLLIESNWHQIRFYSRLFGPIVECYCAAANCLPHLNEFPNGLEESKFVSYVYQQQLKRLNENLVVFPESLNVELIRTSLKLFEKWKAVGCELEGRSRLVLLEFPFSNDARLLEGIEDFLGDFLPDFHRKW